MARKAVTSGGTRDEILRTAKRMFLEKGFDGVTIRTIQREVGCEVGLFYYYFKSKEQVFDVVMDEFESEWRTALDKKLENVLGSRAQRLMAVFQVVRSIVKDFSAQSAANLHWSVRGAVSHRLGVLAEEYVAEILGAAANTASVDNGALGAMLSGGLVRLAEGSSMGETERAENAVRELFESLLGDSEETRASGRRQDISVVLL